MTARDAREILLLYRPGTTDAEDPQVLEAMAVARADPELAEWFREHCVFQKAMRAGFREIKVPPGLKHSILARSKKSKIIPLPMFARAPVWLAAAACVLLFATAASLWMRPRVVNDYYNFQARMVSAARRDYRMDIRTKSMEQVRSYLASQGAPGDYEVPGGLDRTSLTGAGALRWRSNPVSMVCFTRGDDQMLFLFVIARSAVDNPPPEKPRMGKQNDYLAVSWTRGDKTYLLAGPEEPGFLKKYLP